jgi:hypothetical protein
LLNAKLAEVGKLQAEVDLLRASRGELVLPDEGKPADRPPPPDTLMRQSEGKVDGQGPLVPRRASVDEYWDLTLDEALRSALANSKVLRNLGGSLSAKGRPQSLALADFEAGLVNFIGDLERAYWDLYYNYRHLDAVQAGRDAALATWRKVHALHASSGKGGGAEKEAQLREQFMSFRAQVENSLGLLYTAESRLRYMMGLAPSDGRLIRPKDEPVTAEVRFDWKKVLPDALDGSVELRRQKWLVKQNERKVAASRKFLASRLDGQDLDGQSGVGGQLQTGPFKLTVPRGLRLASAGVRNAELVLKVSRALLQDQELDLVHQMTNAIRDLDRNYQVSVTTFNRRVAAARQVKSVEAALDVGTATLDMLLDAQRRLADAEIAYYRALVDYNVAIVQVHFRKGSLLDHNGIELVERPQPDGQSTPVRPEPSEIVGQMDGGDVSVLLIRFKPRGDEPVTEWKAEFKVKCAGYDAPAAPSSRREPHPPRPFSTPVYPMRIER